KCRSRPWAALLARLLLATTALSAQAAELRIGDSRGYPGDTVEITLSLQGDGVTTSANFLIERSWSAAFSSTPATVLVPGVSCGVEGERFRVISNVTATTSLVDICVMRMTIHTFDQPINPFVFGQSQQCRDANQAPQPCSIARGYIDVIHEFERSFIAVLRDPPAAPSLQEVVDFNYGNTGATPPLGFVDAVRPQYVRKNAFFPQSAYGQWILANPQSPIARLHQRGARFTFTTLEQREQALAAARSDPAVHDIVDTLGLVGPEPSYPALLRENEPFGVYLLGASCPSITIATPESRSIEIDGNTIDIVLQVNPNQVCLGLPPSGNSSAVIQIPGLAAGTYTANIRGGSLRRSIELVVHPAGLASTEPSQIPNPDLRLWLVLGVLILAFWRFSTAGR
ncbi:MAG: hypothetical protein ACT4NL_10640, partial [Pseudomarimonas sp.]